MPTPDVQQLPPRPSLHHLKQQARVLRKAFQQGDAESIERLRQHVPRLQDTPSDRLPSDVTTSESQLTIAREYGFASWRDLKSHVESERSSAPASDANEAFSHSELITYFASVRDRHLDTLRQSLEAKPALTEARVNERAMNLRDAAFDEALRQPLTDHSRTAIHQASNSYWDRQAGHRRGDDVIRVLLEFDADPDSIGYDGNNGHCAPIVIATWEGGVETMRLLLEAGADVSGDQGIAALSTAASHDSTERFDLLLEFGAQASPWMLVKAGLSDRVLALIDEEPALLSATDDDGYTLLQAAAKRMKADGFERLPAAGRRIAEAMIERGVEVDAFTAAALNDVDRLRSIVQAHPGQTRLAMSDGMTPVLMAVQARSNDALRVLLEAGAEADTEALRWAARMDYTDACRMLLEYGAQVTDEVTLAAAWRNQDPACLELVLAHGGNPNAADIRAPLHWVASNPQAVQLLIDAGANVNMRAPGGTQTTPLHHAANNADSTARLLAAGADPTLADANGDTPLDLAEKDGAQDVVELLRPRVEAALAISRANDAFSHDQLVDYFAAFSNRDLDALRVCLEANPALTEARANDKVIGLRGEALSAALKEPLSDESSTAIHLAANNYLDRPLDEPPKGADAIRLLLEYGAEPDAVGYNENTGHSTAIVIAAWIGSARQTDPTKDDPVKLQLLLDAGADATGKYGIAALETAASHDRIRHFDLLVEHGAPSSPWLLVRAGLTDRVLALVDEDPAWLTRQNEKGQTLLQSAVMRMEFDEGEEQTEGLRMGLALIGRGADVDVFTAAALNDVERLRALLHADPSSMKQRRGDGRTPVFQAALVGSHDTLRLLLESGAEADEEALVRATRGDDTECSRLLIEHGAQVNDRVVLSAAWRNQESAVLQLVLDNGGDPDAIGPNGTALHWVAAENSQSVQLLIDAGADVNKRAQTIANTPLHSVGNNVDSAVRLLSAGADPSLPNANGDTPLQRAEQLGHDDVANLLRRHTPAAAPERRVLAPTHEFAIAVGGLELDRVRQLISEDPTLVDADVQGNASIDGSWGYGRGRSPEREDATARAVHFAAYRHPELMQLLIDHGADVDALGYEGNYGWAPPLVLACWEGSVDTVRLLLEAGANPNLPAVHGGPALQAAINHYDDDKIELMLQHGARHDIFSAAAVGDLDEVKRLLQEDPFRLHRQDLRRRRTPLGWAIFHERPHIIDYLLEIGVRPRPHELISLGRVNEIRKAVADDPEFVHRRDDGYGDGADPPLLWAVQAGHLEVAQVLLDAGADPNVHGRWESPLRLAYDDVEMARLLIDAGAEVNGSVFPGWTILASTVQRRGFDVAELLLERGADIDGLGGDAGARKGWGLTPLQTAVRQCSDSSSVEDAIQKMTFLLDRGADINAMSRDGQTALDVELAKKGDVRFVNAAGLETFLREHGGKRAEEVMS